MQEIIDMIFYMLEKFWTLIFGLYIVEGVSVGMLFICCLIFSMIIRYVIAIPKAIPRTSRRYYDVYKNNEFNGYDHNRHYYK